ncbi:DUF3103 family protein [Streptomyces sp. NPDC048636]|uniref:DUF3103 family protein n=1 Tax=Streptomyces sp. NPDC048636 TaxID=3155762 RepID=UPI00342C112A
MSGRQTSRNPRIPRDKRVRRTVLAGAALLATCATIAPAAVAAPSPPPSSGTAGTSAVGRIEDSTARTLAASLGDATWRGQLRKAVLGGEEVDLQALSGRTAAPNGKRLTSSLADADRKIAAAKGLGADTGSLLRLRLGDSSMRDDLEAGTAPLIAVASNDDRTGKVTAYDSQGVAHTLDARKAPDRPVYVLDIDESKALAAGMRVLRAEFTARGLATPHADTSAAGEGFAATRITDVELSDDEEPWVKGDAEIYTLVTGFGQDGKVRVDPVEMPYLDEDGKVYHPNQILVNWSNYKYDLADAVMMEEDGSTNYRDLAKAIAGVLLTITDQGSYIPLVNAVLDAIPDDWWTDDPDYVESWYTLAKDAAGRRDGARGNGWMTLEPYQVQGA